MTIPSDEELNALIDEFRRGPAPRPRPNRDDAIDELIADMTYSEHRTIGPLVITWGPHHDPARVRIEWGSFLVRWPGFQIHLYTQRWAER